MNTDKIMALCDQVRETAYAIHEYHGNGYLEKVYENALVHRLKKVGLDVKQQHRLIIYDEDGTEIGEYYADLFIENELIVELKACKSITAEHQAQLIHYLKGAGKEHGLLINFGSYKFEIKKFAKSKNPISKMTGLAPLLFFAISAFFRG
jgi:GxxExxY protein